MYLRTLSDPVRASAGYPPAEVFPLIHVAALGPFILLAKIEAAREAATILMLAAVAAAATQTFRAWLAAFSLVFGVWDLTFYLWLKVLIGWPASLGTWDLLFLLPVPWAGPVIAPSIVSLSLIAGGAIGLLREPKRVRAISWALLLLGGVLIYTSFVWDWRYIAGGGMPRSFPWAIFLSGEIAGVIGFITALGTFPNQTS